MQFYLKLLDKLIDVTVFDMDEAKRRPMTLVSGYRYLPSPNKPAVKRIEPVAMLHFSPKGRLLITDKNRADLDWSNRSFTWRYRNRQLKAGLNVLEIFEPPVIPAGFERGKPSAGEIEQHDC
jgi:hypothetical protein